MAKTVPVFVQLTVNPTSVDTRTDGVRRVLQVGLVTIVPQVLFAD